MFEYTKIELNKIAKETHYITNTIEKVLRLSEILNYIAEESKYADLLALKGGTAINLFLLDLPRLSVDIDFDFTRNCAKNEMEIYRKEIREFISGYMQDEGYDLSDRSRFSHSLDSFVFGYRTLAESNDVLKIEINYSNRCHILKPVESVSTSILGKQIKVRRLDDDELIGSKINALVARTTPRDVYDVYKLIEKRIITNEFLVKKIALFYLILGSDGPIEIENILGKAYERMEALNYNIIKGTLLPVLHKGEKVSINEISESVICYLKKLFVLNKSEKDYIEKFNRKEYNPKLLFEDFDINDLSEHPMALWKMQ